MNNERPITDNEFFEVLEYLYDQTCKNDDGITLIEVNSVNDKKGYYHFVSIYHNSNDNTFMRKDISFPLSTTREMVAKQLARTIIQYHNGIEKDKDDKELIANRRSIKALVKEEVERELKAQKLQNSKISAKSKKKKDKSITK